MPARESPRAAASRSAARDSLLKRRETRDVDIISPRSLEPRSYARNYNGARAYERACVNRNRNAAEHTLEIVLPSRISPRKSAVLIESFRSRFERHRAARSPTFFANRETPRRIARSRSYPKAKTSSLDNELFFEDARLKKLFIIMIILSE